MRRTHLSLMTLLIAAGLLWSSVLVGPRDASAAITATASTTTTSNWTIAINGQEQALPWLSVFFTDPAHTDETDQNLDHYIVRYALKAVNSAQKTIDITSFDFSLPSFVNVLLAAKKRGDVVLIVLDKKNGSQDVKNGDSSDGETVSTPDASNERGEIRYLLTREIIYCTIHQCNKC